jgi:hypothetical protein
VSPWFARSFTDSVLLALGILERAADQESFVTEGYFDLDALPILPTMLKASTRSRRAQDVPYIVCHVTAVTGGFGLASRKLGAAAVETSPQRSDDVGSPTADRRAAGRGWRHRGGRKRVSSARPGPASRKP